MKRKYLVPRVEVVKLNLVGSLMEEFGFGGNSQETGYDAAAKRHWSDSAYWDEEEEEAEGEVLLPKSVWE